MQLESVRYYEGGWRGTDLGWKHFTFQLRTNTMPKRQQYTIHWMMWNNMKNKTNQLSDGTRKNCTAFVFRTQKERDHAIINTSIKPAAMSLIYRRSSNNNNILRQVHSAIRSHFRHCYVMFLYIVHWTHSYRLRLRYLPLFRSSTLLFVYYWPFP